MVTNDETLMGAKKVIARSLEVNLTAHCNLACYGCDHASPVHPEQYLDVDELAADLAELSKVYHVFEFRLTGGEPLLHPELVRVVDAIRDSGISDKVTMVTNGVLLHQAPTELWEKLDKMWVSLYPGVNRRLENEAVQSLADRYGVLLYLKPTNEFSVKLLHSVNRDRELVETIYATCALRSSCHTIHQGRYYKCSPSPFMSDWLARIGAQPHSFIADCVPVRDNPNLREQLADFLASEKPLEACSYCLGVAGKLTPSRQMNKADVQEWLSRKDPEDVRELIDWDLPATYTKNALDRLRRANLSGMLSTMVGVKLAWLARSLHARTLGRLRRTP